MDFKGLIYTCAAVLLAACGHLKPAKFDEQVQTINKAVAKTPIQWAERGWWSYLNQDIAAAKLALRQAGDVPLARLGLAIIALNEHKLDRAIEQLQAIPDGGLVGRIAARKRYVLTGTDVSQKTPLRWSGRITPWVHLGLNTLIQDSPFIRATKRDFVNAYGDDHRLGERGNEAGITLAIINSQPNSYFEISTRGATAIWNEEQHNWQQTARESTDLWVPVQASKHLIIAWASTASPRARLYIDDGTQSSLNNDGPAVAGRALGQNWVYQFLLALNTVERGDGDGALYLLRQAPETAAFDHLRARAYGDSIDTPQSLARDRQIRLWRRAQKLTPYAAHFALATLYRQTGQIEKARQHLLALTRQFPPNKTIHAEWIRVLDRLGRNSEARAYISRFGQPCEHLELRQRLLRYRDPRPLAKRLQKCGLNEQAAELLLQYHRPKDVLELLASTPALWARKSDQRIRALIALSRLPVLNLREIATKSESVGLTALDFALSAGATDDFHGQVRAWVAANMTSLRALHLMATNPSWSPLHALYLDTEAAIKSHRQNSTIHRTERLLDHSILLYDSAGNSVRRVHEVLSIGSRSAAERFGELGLPEDAIPVTIYTRKANGTIRYAEMATEKDSFSLPDLSPGDFIVAIYLEPNGHAGTADGRFLSQRTYFGDFDIKIGHQRLDIIPPVGSKMDTERQFAAPLAQRFSADKRLGVRFEARDIQPVMNEPRSPVPEAIIPSVRVGSQVSLEENLLRFRELFLATTYISPQFRQWALSAGKTASPKDPVQALLTAVRRQYDGSVGLVAERVGRGLHDGVGHRTQALSAALRVLGIGHAVHLAGASDSPDAMKFRQVSDYQTPLIRLNDGRWIYPGPDRGPVGYLPFSLLGGQSLIIWPPSAPTQPRMLPTRRSRKDSRHVRLSAHLDSASMLSGQVIDVLMGAESIAVGRLMNQLEKSERPRLVERILVKAITSGQIDRLKPIHKTPDTDALTLAYQFSGALPSPNRVGCFPIQPGHTFALLELRQTPLLLSLPVDQTVEIHLTSAHEITMDDKPIDLTHGPHTFSRRVVKSWGKTVITCRLEIAGGHILPADYPGFRDWARKVDRAEYISITHHAQ